MATATSVKVGQSTGKVMQSLKTVQRRLNSFNLRLGSPDEVKRRLYAYRYNDCV